MRWMRNVNLPFWQRFALAVVLGVTAAAPAWAQYKPYFSSVREVVTKTGSSKMMHVSWRMGVR